MNLIDEIPSPEEQEQDAQRWNRLEKLELNSRMTQVRGVPVEEDAGGINE